MWYAYVECGIYPAACGKPRHRALFGNRRLLLHICSWLWVTSYARYFLMKNDNLCFSSGTISHGLSFFSCRMPPGAPRGSTRLPEDQESAQERWEALLCLLRGPKLCQERSQESPRRSPLGPRAAPEGPRRSQKRPRKGALEAKECHNSPHHSEK